MSHGNMLCPFPHARGILTYASSYIYIYTHIHTSCMRQMSMGEVYFSTHQAACYLTKVKGDGNYSICIRVYQDHMTQKYIVILELMHTGILLLLLIIYKELFVTSDYIITYSQIEEFVIHISDFNNFLIIIIKYAYTIYIYSNIKL